MPPETNQTTQPTSSPTFFGVDPTQISDPQGQTFYKAWTNAQQNPDSPLASSFIQGVKSGQYNDMAQAAGIDMTKYPQIFQTGVSTPSSSGGTINDITQTTSDIKNQTEGHAANIVQDFSQKPSMEGALDVTGNVAGEVGDFIGDGLNLLAKATTPKPVYDAVASTIAAGVKAAVGTPAAQGLLDQWNKFEAQNPTAAKDIGNTIQIGALAVGADEGPTVEDAQNFVKQGANVAKDMVTNTPKDVVNSVKNLVTGDPATNEAIGNIAKQEGGIVAPAKTASQVAQESQQSTWDVIKPKLSPDELKTAAANGGLVRTGENGVLTQVPTPKDIVDIKLAQPYVEAAGGDPVKAAANIKQGIADEAQQLRSAVQNAKGGTFSTSNIKGVLNDVNIPSAIKGGAEMNQINNIKDFVTSIADKVDKNPGGALDLAQQFRQTVNSDFGENVWGKSTPIGNYIKNVNKALNDFISTRLPNGTLPDGTLIKDSFAKQTQLYNIYDNIQIPKVGDQLVTPTEEAPLKDLGSPLEQTIAKHPVVTKVIKTVGEGVGLGGIIKHIP